MYMRNGNCWFFLGPELQIQFKGKKKKKKAVDKSACKTESYNDML